MAIGKWIDPPHFCELFLADLYHLGFLSKISHTLLMFFGCRLLAQPVTNRSVKSSNRGRLIESIFLPQINDAG